MHDIRHTLRGCYLLRLKVIWVMNECSAHEGCAGHIEVKEHQPCVRVMLLTCTLQCQHVRDVTLVPCLTSGGCATHKFQNKMPRECDTFVGVHISAGGMGQA